MNKINYAQFNVTDFVCDDGFLKHYLSPTETTQLFFKKWLAQNPTKRAEWEQAEHLLEAVKLGLTDYTRTFLSPEAEANLLARIYETNALRNEETPIVPMRQMTWIWGSAAAAACILLVYGLWFFNKPTKDTPSVYSQQIETLAQAHIEKKNDSDQSMFVVLPDSSKVILAPKSRLSYPVAFDNDTRTVYLSGEATFSVVKDLNKPFYVHANEIVTKVLGTQFIVRAFDKDKDVVVTVQSGRVSVYRPDKTSHIEASNTKTEGVLLLPNQQVVFGRLTDQFKKSLISQPALIALPAQEAVSFEFNETPIIEAFARIKKAYGIDIVYNAETLKGCEITASLNEESLFEKLNTMTQIINGSYETVEGQIVVTSKGCK